MNRIEQVRTALISLNPPIVRKWHWYEHIALNIYWLGLNINTGLLTPILLPYLVLLFMPPQQKNTYLAVIRVISLAMAMLVQPVAGMLSDRSTSRWGRRRPFIFIGAIGSILCLGVIASSTFFMGSDLNRVSEPVFGVPVAYLILLAGIVLLQIPTNIAQGAAQALIPDLVPENQRGRSSGFKSVLELIPVFVVILAGPLVDQGRVWLVVGIISTALLGCLLITLYAARETPLREKPDRLSAGPVLRIVALTAIFVGATQAAAAFVRFAGRLLTHASAPIALQIMGVGLAGLAAMAGSIFLGVYLGVWAGIGEEARRHNAFIWWIINRLMFLAAIGSIQGFAQYFLRDVLQVPNVVRMTTLLLAVVALFLVPSAIAGGYLADRFGRKRLVQATGLLAALGTLVLIFSRSMPLVMVSGGILGLATGTFMATNWALGTDLVPDSDAGRYLGISNLAGAGAGIVGVGIGGPTADFFNAIRPGLGYPVIFGIYCALFLLSTLALTRVKPKEG